VSYVESSPPDPPSREQLRSRRKREVRAKTISSSRTTRRELHLLVAEADADLHQAGEFFSPTTRGDCAQVVRPCPHVSCKYNLYLDVSNATGAVKLNFPDLEPHELPANGSCALDVADRGGATLEQTAEYTNLTRQRVRQIELSGAHRLLITLKRLKLAEPFEEWLRDREASGDDREDIGEDGGGMGGGAPEPESAEVDRWSNEVLAEWRAGMPLLAAAVLASEPVEGREDLPVLVADPEDHTPPPPMVTPAERRTQPPRSVEHMIPRERDVIGDELDPVVLDKTDDEAPDPVREREEPTMGQVTEETRELSEKILALLKECGPMRPREMFATMPKVSTGRVTNAMRVLVDDGTGEIAGWARSSVWSVKGDKRNATPVTETKAAKPRPAKAPVPRGAIVHAPPAPVAAPMREGSWMTHLVMARDILAAKIAKIDAILADMGDGP